MTTTNPNATGLTLIDATIAPVESQYSDAISAVRATLVYATGERVTARHERLALAAAHRMVADLIELLDRLPPGLGYTAPEVEVTGSYRDRVHVAIRYELTTGAKAEVDAVLELMHDAVPPPDEVA